MKTVILKPAVVVEKYVSLIYSGAKYSVCYKIQDLESTRVELSKTSKNIKNGSQSLEIQPSKVERVVKKHENSYIFFHHNCAFQNNRLHL